MVRKYKHGGDIYGIEGRSIIDFSANINPLGIPKSVKEAIIESFDKCSAYPDPFCRELVKAIAKKEGVRESEVVCGNGAADLIFRIPRALDLKKILVTGPTFSEYEEAVVQNGGESKVHILKEEDGFSLGEDFIDNMDGVDAIYICNPNNPTGVLTSKKVIFKILEKAALNKQWVIIDECFNSFLKDSKEFSLVEDIASFKNLIILKAFTKDFAMAGFRLGYCLSSNEEALDKIFAEGQPWSVSTLAQVAGVSALEERDYLEITKEFIEKERRFLEEGLLKLGISFVKSRANYILLKTEKIGGNDFRNRLRQRDILVRDCSNYNGLTEDFTRIAIRCRRENEILLDNISQILGEVE